MKKSIILVLSLFSSLIFNGQAKYYLCEQAGQPFGSPANVNNMNTAFGAGNWTQSFFQTVNVNALLQPSVCLIYLDGSSTGANEFNTFFATNSAALQNWVSSGGHLLMNAAPNEGGNINLGFGGVILTYSTGPYNKTITAVPAQSNHAIYNGPALPCGTTFTANYVSHGFISGGAPTALITGTAGTALAELSFGTGKVMFGTIIPSSFMEQPIGPNFKSNILSYLGSACGNVGIGSTTLSNEGIRIFPNPGTGIYMIEFENGAEKLIRVSEFNGRLVKEIASSDDKIKLDLSAEEKGVYMVEIKSNNFSYIIKVVKI